MSDERPGDTDGGVALVSTSQAAELSGLSVAAFHVAMHRERSRGNDLRAARELWLDGRTPMWDRVAVAQWGRTRRRIRRRSSPQDEQSQAGGGEQS